MDQDLKQRLVGAVVITSLAAIFVPMLFDDPIDEKGKMVSELQIPDAPVNLLNTEATRLPKSIDDVISLPEVQVIKQQDTMDKPAKVADKMLRWFVQVGIFGQEENATALQKEIRKQGYPVIITKVPGKNGFLYRVKVGPELSRERAEKMKIKISKTNNIKGMVTSQQE